MDFSSGFQARTMTLASSRPIIEEPAGNPREFFFSPPSYRPDSPSCALNRGMVLGWHTRVCPDFSSSWARESILPKPRPRRFGFVISIWLSAKRGSSQPRCLDSTIRSRLLGPNCLSKETLEASRPRGGNRASH